MRKILKCTMNPGTRGHLETKCEELKRPTRRVNRHMLQDAILQCETSTKFTTDVRPRRVGPKRRGRARESRSRFVDMDDQWTFQCEIQKRHPLRDETSTDETTPKPDRPRPHLGRNRVLAYGPVTFPHSGVSRVSASVRLKIQGHSARRVTSRVRQCHLLIKNLGDFSDPIYTCTVVRLSGWPTLPNGLLSCTWHMGSDTVNVPVAHPSDGHDD